MAWPDRPQKLPIRTELAFGADPTGDPATWAWMDVSEHVEDQSITITRGRGEEGGETRPASTGLELVNNGGDYTPGHAGGAHYPHVRLGVPARISVQAGGPHLHLPASGAHAATSATTGLTVTDLDARAEIALERVAAQYRDVTPGNRRPWQTIAQEIIGRPRTDGTLMWHLAADMQGGLLLMWVTSSGVRHDRSSTDVLPYGSGQRCAVRATLDVNNGAGGHTVTFYHATTMDGPWAILGQPLTTSGATSIPQGDATPLRLGRVTTENRLGAAGRIYRAEVRNGIDGTILASPDLRGVQSGATSWTDSTGKTWIPANGAKVTDWVPHVTGTVDEWAPHWPWGDLSVPGYDGEARTDITISGILRRLGTGQPPLQSALRRRVPAGGPLAYWPLEDEPGATSAASGLDGGKPLTVNGLRFGESTSLLASDALPTVTAGARIRANVRAGAEGDWTVTMFTNLAQNPATESTLLELQTARGTWTSYRVTISNNAVSVYGINDSGSSSSISRILWVSNAEFAGGWRRLRLSGRTTGNSTTLMVSWIFIGGGGGTQSATFTGRAGVVSRIDTTFGADLAGMGIGHLSVMSWADTWVYNDSDDGFTGETALARMRRLAEEERLPLSVIGIEAASPAMGPQRIATFLELIQECVDADGGVLTELRGLPGLQYRSRESLFNQKPTVVLDAQANEISSPFSPVLDDQRTRNRITVSRDGGSSATVEDEESIAESGIYDGSAQLNVAYDTQLEALAGWRLHLGTVRGMRYPQVGADLAIAPRLIDGWLSVDSGTRIDVTGLPPQHPQGTVPLMVEGTTETITPTRWTVRATCSPASPWTAGVVGDDQLGRVDTDGTVLAGPVAAADGTILTRVTAGPTWTRAASDLPYTLTADGEEVTVTAVTDARDTFQRTVGAGSWGAASGGLPWLLSGGSAAERSVAAGRGLVTVSSATVSTVRIQALAGPIGDVDVRVRMSVPQVSTGAALIPGVLLRYVDGSNYYRARLHFNAGGTLSTSITRTVTQVGSTVAVSGGYTAGAEFEVRARVDGHRIRMRVWPVGSAEPTTWHQDQAITTDPIEHGLVGVTAGGFASNTNTDPQIRFDQFEAVGVQQMTVTRSNPQDHAAGGDVRLTQPAIVV
ncbi:hypothetical protein ACFWDT_05865 [Streptomyces diastaticus]|uniref:hypothetical protein n=1 Tax=Streptomyces diastaticus TaxID=1956 RepID=UPI00367433B2